MDVTIEKILDIVRKTDSQIDDSILTPNAVLTKIGADSLDMMNIFVELDSVLGYVVPDEDIDNLLSVQDIYEYAINKKN
jgi:acyl carrier protein